MQLISAIIRRRPRVNRRLCLAFLAFFAFGASCVHGNRPADAIQLCLLNCGCTVNASTIAFGNYDTLSSSPTLAVGTLTLNCQILNVLGVTSLSLPVKLSLTAGGGSFATRQLAGPRSQHLNYNLYNDSGMTQIWGDGTSGTQTLSSALVLTAGVPSITQNLTIYARIPARQNVGTGRYTDTVVASIDF